ncbi:MAG: hypothetical protein IPJ50_03860 [Betaproteobacteria bacterium]|nr:hypothetical protein [Betaproteobacteria bacterium]
MMLPTSFWLHPLGWLTAAVAAAGVIPALLSLSNRIGRKRQHPARIEAIRQHTGQVIEIVCRPQTGLARPPGRPVPVCRFRPNRRRCPSVHYYLGLERQGRHLTLAIKALGDFTNQLSSQLETGQRLIARKAPTAPLIFAEKRR